MIASSQTPITLASSPQTITLPALNYPVILTLQSTAATRTIEVSADGTNFFTPTLDYTSTGAVQLIMTAPPKSVRVTATIGDVLNITGN